MFYNGTRTPGVPRGGLPLQSRLSRRPASPETRRYASVRRPPAARLKPTLGRPQVRGERGRSDLGMLRASESRLRCAMERPQVVRSHTVSMVVLLERQPVLKNRRGGPCYTRCTVAYRRARTSDQDSSPKQFEWTTLPPLSSRRVLQWLSCRPRQITPAGQ